MAGEFALVSTPCAECARRLGSMKRLIASIPFCLLRKQPGSSWTYLFANHCGNGKKFTKRLTVTKLTLSPGLLAGCCWLRKNFQCPEKRVDFSLCKKHSSASKTTRGGVRSIAKAIFVCGRQGFALRSQEDNFVIDRGTDYYSTADIRYGNFNALLLLQLSSGDEALKHLTVNTWTCQTEPCQSRGLIARQD